MLTNLCNEEDYQSIFPSIKLCGDNAAMIAMVGLEKFKLKQTKKNLILLHLFKKLLKKYYIKKLR